MTEDEAKDWVRATFGSEATTLLASFVALLHAGSDTRNLVSVASRDAIWSRHIVDSAQLLDLAAPAPSGVWVDIGSGAGLPGMVVACLIERPMILVEPRRLRAEFLSNAAAALGLSQQVTVLPVKSERTALDQPAAIISARAVSALPSLLAGAAHLADQHTLWLLPKGRTARSEVADARRSWQGTFHVKPSITDEESGIVIAQGVYRR